MARFAACWTTSRPAQEELMLDVRRREFITLLGGAAAGWPLAARAQQPNRVRRIGVLIPYAADDPEALARVGAFLQGLQQLGWTVGGNMRIDYRFSAGSADLARKYAAELVALAPDVILANGGAVVAPLLQVTGSVPIVFVQVTDPVGGGFVDSLARPGRNATGFTVFEYSIGGKWLELLKQVAPHVTRVAVFRDPVNPAGTGLLGAIQTVAPSFGVEASSIGLREAGEIERGLSEFARRANGGLIVTPSALASVHRQLIIAQATRHRLPAVYPFRYFVTDGGLIYYGPDTLDLIRRSAGYVDRILKGEKPADLPVQNPTKYELAINLKTSKVLGLTVPPSLLALADEVIE
jgi:putative ABC transport system substrate-binding protein